MRLGQDVLSDHRVALSAEWLLANGIGGSACGTIASLPQRAAHAHLFTCGPHGRLFGVLVARALEPRIAARERVSIERTDEKQAVPTFIFRWRDR